MSALRNGSGLRKESPQFALSGRAIMKNGRL
jgi:hypothetical protein